MSVVQQSLREDLNALLTFHCFVTDAIFVKIFFFYIIMLDYFDILNVRLYDRYLEFACHLILAHNCFQKIKWSI